MIKHFAKSRQRPTTHPVTLSLIKISNKEEENVANKMFLFIKLKMARKRSYHREKIYSFTKMQKE